MSGPEDHLKTGLVKGRLRAVNARWVLETEDFGTLRVEVDMRSPSRYVGQNRTWHYTWRGPKRPGVLTHPSRDGKKPQKVVKSVRAVSGGLPTLGRRRR